MHNQHRVYVEVDKFLEEHMPNAKEIFADAHKKSEAVCRQRRSMLCFKNGPDRVETLRRVAFDGYQISKSGRDFRALA
jgi:hypothetical protein